MNTITTAVLIVAGTYLIAIAQLMTTKNVKSGIVFKAIPTLIGIMCFIVVIFNIK